MFKPLYYDPPIGNYFVELCLPITKHCELLLQVNAYPNCRKELLNYDVFLYSYKSEKSIFCIVYNYT